jgi:hypothetical protein
MLLLLLLVVVHRCNALRGCQLGTFTWLQLGGFAEQFHACRVTGMQRDTSDRARFRRVFITD